MGTNAIEYLLSSLDGNVYLKPTFDFQINKQIDTRNIRVNGKGVSDIKELEEELCM